MNHLTKGLQYRWYNYYKYDPVEYMGSVMLLSTGLPQILSLTVYGPAQIGGPKQICQSVSQRDWNELLLSGDLSDPARWK